MKITTIGEVLIDMTEIGRDENGIPRFQANPGGAPANVAVAVSKLGGEAGFIGCVGEDAFGAFLRETLVRCGVDVHGLQIARDASTTLAVGSIPMPSGISLDSAGGASFVEIGVKPLNSHRTVHVQLYQPNLTVKAPEGMTYSVNKDVLEITVRGDAADLEGVSSSDVRLTMDLSGFTTEGIKTGVPVVVDQTSLRAKNCYATGDYSITVTVTDPGGGSDD